AFSMPALNLSRIVELVGPAFTIAMLGAIESLLSAVVADGMAGTKHDSNQELVGQGLANMVTPFFGGFAATGAIARTATNIRNGGTSPLAGMMHAVTLVLVILVLAPLAANVPLAALAAILFVVAYNMSDVKHFALMARRAPRADSAILVMTFLLTVFADLVVAVNIGVILATLQFLRRMSSSVEVQRLTDEHLGPELAKQGLEKLPADVLVYSIEGPFFFGAVENFERTLALFHTEPRVLILRLRRVPFMDMTGLLTLEEVIGALQKRGVRVMLCEANERVKGKLVKAGVLNTAGPENCVDDFSQALAQCHAARELGGKALRKKRLSVAAHKLIETSKNFFLVDKE
ncbi:SulP family inorganic anion transporter, partial [Massilia cavernae]